MTMYRRLMATLLVGWVLLLGPQQARACPA